LSQGSCGKGVLAVTAASVSLGLRFLIGLVLLTAALPKLRNSADFRDAVSNYGILPQALVPVFARWLPRIELVLGAALLVGFLPTIAAALAGALLLLFAAAVAYNLARGRAIECGCLSTSAPRKITWPIVHTDLLLAAAAVVVTLTPAGTWTIVDIAATDHAEPSGGDAVALLLAATCLVLLARLAQEGLRLRSVVRAVIAGDTA
jgi:uncharacterized membrane protein YphA (DoxX/SURF4 family)